MRGLQWFVDGALEPCPPVPDTCVASTEGQEGIPAAPSPDPTCTDSPISVENAEGRADSGRSWLSGDQDRIVSSGGRRPLPPGAHKPGCSVAIGTPTSRAEAGRAAKDGSIRCFPRRDRRWGRGEKGNSKPVQNTALRIRTSSFVYTCRSVCRYLHSCGGYHPDSPHTSH